MILIKLSKIAIDEFFNMSNNSDYYYKQHTEMNFILQFS